MESFFKYYNNIGKNLHYLLKNVIEEHFFK